ncbi:MAG: pyridoxamine 5'-phosphate oxidase [Ruminococcaceae bacterium]|nr:pyridoxamine 5'-phosphate oxidase [Oscillospiraceae bacterium]
MEKVYEFLNGCNAFYFTTVDGDAPRCRPFGFKMMFEDKLYFGLGTHKASFAELEKNPNVEICAMSTADRGAFIRIRGKAVIDARDEVQTAMYEASPFLSKTYNAETGWRHECIYLEDMSAVVFHMGKGEEKIY